MIQCRATAHIKALQLVGFAVQIIQCRILTHIKAGQLIFDAVQLGQCRILAHIKALQLVGEAVQIFQCCEILHAREFLDAHVDNIDLRRRCDLVRCQDIVIGRVEVLVNVASEHSVREVCLADLNVSLRR